MFEISATPEPRLTILHIDDNEANRYVVTRTLQNARFTVVEAATGTAGLTAIAKHQPALVILDVQLPDMNGFEVCRQVKANPETASTPVLHLSASFVQSRDKAEGLDSGADAYLVQPVEPIELLATVRALLRIRQAEEAALASAREWQTTFDAINDGVCSLDQNGKFLRCNTAMSRLLCQPASKILGCTHSEVLKAALGVGDGTCFRLAKSTHQRQVLELYAKGRWFAKTVDPVLDEQGIFTGAALILADITDRKQVEAALQLSEERLRLATEAADIGMWFWDLAEDRLVWTTYCKQLFGLDPATEISYPRFLEALHPDDRDHTHAAVQEAITQKQEYAIEYRSLWDDGSIHWILAKGRAFYNQQGEPVRMMGIAQDITDRKQAQVALQLQTDELSQLNQQLTQTTDLINQRNEELDQFAHVVSHDLKAPLRSIANLSTWIEEDLGEQAPPEAKQNLGLLRSRVSRMEGLINGLLTYARIGYQAKPDEPFALNELLLEIIDSLDIPPQFTVQIPPNLLTITTNRLLLGQVFSNLISNAVKHHDRPDGQVKIMAQVKTQGYKFTVTDDGPGIAPNYHSRVFEIFQTLASRDNKESTGIGLAIIKKIIERIGGQIELESELGQGATFRFTWPFSELDATR